MKRRASTMSWKEDDEKAYTTYDGIVGRSIRRGTRKALKALTLGLLGGDVVGGSFKALGEDAAKELPTAIHRSRQNEDDD
jgi:hypothetical protein